MNNRVRAIKITDGMKILAPDKESCLKLEKELNMFGIKTRVGRNCHVDLWSVYIISTQGGVIMTKKEFEDTYCRMCGSQRCFGVDDEEMREGCLHYKERMKNVETVEE